MDEALEGEEDPLPKEVKEEIKLISKLSTLPPFLAGIYDDMKDDELAVEVAGLDGG